MSIIKNGNTVNKLKATYLNPLNYAPLTNRQYNEKKRNRDDGDYQRDYTRIMYSSSFRRLQGKMQLLGIRNDQFFRNRLTHSLEVSQIARSIATDIGYSTVDIYVVEAGAIAHDLGNPPFGHYGERILNQLCKEVGGFEGNAQTLRILTTIEKKRPDFMGLNLTYRTLLSITKYFNKFNADLDIDKQKFIYDDDYDLLNQYITSNHVKIRTLDVQIVDKADEIAYAAHDLEDGLRQKLFTIDEILHDFKVKYKDSESYRKLENIVYQSRENAEFGEKAIESSEFSKLFRKELTSSIIYTLIHDLDLIDVTKGERSKTNTAWDQELNYSTYSDLANGLKELTFKCINHNDEVYRYEKLGGKIIKDLFDFYKEDPKYLPPEYRAIDMMKQYGIKQDEDKLQTRLIADYIAGMMDSYALSVYKKLFGEKSIETII